MHLYHRRLDNVEILSRFNNKWLNSNWTASSTTEGKLCPKAAASFSSHGLQRQSQQRHFRLSFPPLQLSFPSSSTSWSSSREPSGVTRWHQGDLVIPIISISFLQHQNLHAVCCLHMILSSLKMGVDLKFIHCLSKYVLKEPYFIKPVIKLCRVQASYRRWSRFRGCKRILASATSTCQSFQWQLLINRVRSTTNLEKLK